MKNLTIYLFCFLALVSCRKDINEVAITEVNPGPTIIDQYNPPIETITGTVIGTVLNELGEGISEASVQIGDQTTESNEFGIFIFRNIELNKKGSIAQVEKDGYFTGSRTFYPIENAQNRIQITLIDRSFDFQIQSQTGGEINFNGASVSFNPNSFTLDGNPYDGEVFIAARYIDVSSPEFLSQQPGILQGVGFSTRNELRSFQTFGMIAVEIVTSGGQELDIADTELATIKIPVPPTLQTNATSEISLWSYNEEYGIWAEESDASYTNGFYVGMVSHFSFWSTSLPYEFVEFSACLTNDAGDVLSNYEIKAMQAGLQLSTSYSNNEGCFVIKVPKFESYTFQIKGRDCVVLEDDFGPFDADVNSAPIRVTIPDEVITEIKAELFCDLNPLSNLLMVYEYNGKSYNELIARPIIELKIVSNCNLIPAGQMLDVQFINLDNMMESGSQMITTGMVNNLDSVNICEQMLENFIQITIGGVEKIYLNPSVIINFGNPNTKVLADNSVGSDQIRVSFSFDGISQGSYENALSTIDFIQSADISWDFTEGGNFDVLNISKYGATFEAIIGDFSGTLKQGANDIPFSGMFHVIRN